MPPVSEWNIFLLRNFLLITIISFKRLPRKRSMLFLVSSANGILIRNLLRKGGSPHKYVSILLFPPLYGLCTQTISPSAQELICSAAFGSSTASSSSTESSSKIPPMASISEIPQVQRLTFPLRCHFSLRFTIVLDSFSAIISRPLGTQPSSLCPSNPAWFA